MEVLKEFKLLAAELPGDSHLGTIRLRINGRNRVFFAQAFNDNAGLRAFDFPEELRVILRQHPQASQRLLQALREYLDLPISLPVDLLAPKAAQELQAA
jgi:hypothetical protein